MRNKITFLSLFFFLFTTFLYSQTPTNGQTGVQVGSVAFSWTAYGGFEDDATNEDDYYILEIGTTSGVYSVHTSTHIPDGTTSYNYSLNTEGQIYYWLVTAYDDAISEATIGEYDFTLGPLDLATPTDASAAIALSSQSFDWGDYSFDGTATANDYYRVKIGSTTGASDVYYTSMATVTASTETIDLSSLTNNTQYFWSVEVYDDDVKVFDFEEFGFTTAIGAPSITAPLNNSFDNLLNTSVSWTQTGPATGITYDFEYHTGGGFPGTTIAGVTSPSLFGLLVNNTAYTIRIHAIKGAEDVISSTVTFTTLLATPDLTAPVVGTEVSTFTPTFAWTMAGITSNVQYEVFFSTSGAGGPFISEASGLTATSYTPGTNLNSSTEYHWKVEASVTSGSNSSQESEVDNFFTPLGLISPVNGLTGVSIEPSFTWENANYDAGGYTVKISTDGGSQANFDAAVIATETTAQDVATYGFVESHISGNMPLANGTLYYWQVVANDGSTDHNSPIFHFTTVPKVNVTLAYPVPGAPVTTLTYTLFTWAVDQPTGDKQYKLQVKASTTEPTATEWLTAEFVDTTSMITHSLDLIGGNDYFWRVVVLNSSGEVISYSSAVGFETDGGVITPVPSSPVNLSSVYTNTPIFYWYIMQVPVNLTYDIQVDDNSDFSSPAIDIEGIPDLYYSPATPLTPGTTYYWHIRSVYLRGTANADTSAWCATQQFTTQGDGTLVVPVPSYPIDNMTVYSTSPFLFWYATNGGVGLVYDIEYNTDKIFSGTPDVEDVANMVTQLSLLQPGETYYWKVRSDNGTNQSAWSDVDSFKVAGGILGGYPVASFPVLTSTTVYTRQPTILWYLEGSFLGLTGYEIRWKAGSSSTDWNSDFDGQKVINDIYQFTYTFESELDNGETYYWAVASTDGAGYSAWSAGAFNVFDGTTIAAPLLLYPTDGVEIFTDNTTLLWVLNASVTGVQGYEVVYSKSDVFESTVTTTVPATSVPGLSVLVEDLTPGATYYWRVRTWYGGSTYSSFSATGNFVVNPGSAPVQPLVGGPTNVSVNTLDPVFSWVLPTQSESQLSYELLVSESADLSDPVVTPTESQVLQISNLENSKKYYWRVRSKTENGDYSYYSNTGSFTTAYSVTSVPETETLPVEFAVSQNYPNPFNPATTFTLSVPETGYVSVKIYDVLGREVKTLLNGEINSGTHQLVWNGKSNSGSRLSSGTYFYRVEAGSNVITKKMLLLK